MKFIKIDFYLPEDDDTATALDLDAEYDDVVVNIPRNLELSYEEALALVEEETEHGHH